MSKAALQLWLSGGAAALLALAASPSRAQDAAGPLALQPFEPAPGGVAPFVLRASDETRARALRCLTQAVYYEAASEPREGQEAVAQVVLNRMKHPAFPKSVCGVVFEGSDRNTGCQFTFTCDGSLSRTPIAERWETAQDVAAAALDGHVERQIGASTHYHAAWMRPYWSASLVQTGRIGGHIFYRMPGVEAAALTGQYSGAEPAAPVGLVAKMHHAGGKNGRPSQTPSVPGVSEFSVWGLQIATVTAHKGEVEVKSGS